MFVLLSFTLFNLHRTCFLSLVIFVLFAIMGKFAFKPIARALEQREADIQMPRPKSARRDGYLEGTKRKNIG
jgi:F0F1-type ATP synthase membrane subunit b/b'